MSDTVTYTHQAYDPRTDESEDNSEDEENNSNYSSKRSPVTIYNDDNKAVMKINYTTPVKDDNTSSRTIPETSDVFRLQHRVNSFSGIRIKEGE